VARLGRRQPNRPIAYSPSASTKYAVPPAIQEDPSAPPPATGTGTTAVTNSFTPVANSLIVAVAACGGGTAVETCPVTDSLGSTWMLLKRANTNNFAGTTEIWVMDAGSSPAARTVTATITGSNGVGVALTVKVLTGAQPAASCLGGFTIVNSTTAYTISITTTTANSLACAGLVDSTGSGALTVNGITTAWQSVSDTTNGHKYATFRATSLTGTPGATVIGFTNGAANNQAIVAVEILPAAGGTDYTVTQTDNTGLIDTAAVAIGQTQTDSTGLTDTSTVQVVKDIIQTDNTGLTDAAEKTISQAQTDSAGLTDTTTAALTKTQTDSAGLTDTAAVELSKLLTQTDDTGLTDTAIRIIGQTVTDTTGLTDTTALTRSATPTDSAGLTDTTAMVSAKSVDQTDSTGLTDTQAMARLTVLTDDAGLTDSATSVLGSPYIPAYVSVDAGTSGTNLDTQAHSGAVDAATVPSGMVDA
jgi:hypothetical protein